MAVMVIDIGSSSVRVMLFDEQARAIPGAVAFRPYQFSNTPAGAAVTDAHHLRQLTEACIDDILCHPRAGEIEIAAMAIFTDSLVGLDDAGQVISPVYTYGDTRSAYDVLLLNDRIDLTATHQRTGCINHTTYLPGRLHWLRRTEPKMFQAARQWLDIATYLFKLWFGDAPCSYSVASWTGLLDRAALAWDAAWFDILGLDPARFPRLSDYDDMQAGLLPAYAARWPALKAVPFCLAVADGAAANVGSGGVDTSHMVLTVGTTAALRIILDAEMPPVPPGLWGYRLDAAHHVIGGATFEGGNIFHWARSVLLLPEDDEALSAELARRPPDSHGLVFLPLLAGERSPGWAGDATGAIAGLRLSTGALDILQAAYEGVALRLALTADQLAPLTTGDTNVMAGGGALAASPVWVQTIANALNRTIHLVAETEITARGTAILALRALGRCSLADHPPAIERIVQPVPEHVAILRGALERQIDLYRKLVNSDYSLTAHS
ncbi:MAG: carbohydrate kinase [Anaerolineae bacterium]|nr:carbohydrate kinase [Anaerolineae bacterium]